METIKILIAEDNAVMRKILRALLTQRDKEFQIYEAQSGEDVERLVEELEINWLFLDLYLPNINGDKIVSSIKENSKFDSLDIVMISAETDRSKIVDLLKSERIFNYLSKPINKERFQWTIEELLKKSL